MEKGLVTRILFFFLIVLKTFFSLNTGKIRHVFHLKASNVGEGENVSNQHFLIFLSCFFKDFFSQWHEKTFLFGGGGIKC